IQEQRAIAEAGLHEIIDLEDQLLATASIPAVKAQSQEVAHLRTRISILQSKQEELQGKKTPVEEEVSGLDRLITWFERSYQETPTILLKKVRADRNAL